VKEISKRRVMTQNDLKGKVVVITGASSGFGKGSALKFAREGASLVLAARRSYRNLPNSVNQPEQ
jgi:NADP-dependent 3-hydroxy acid dehydrogenase YdfG